ncbi:phosphoenolpyruvate--protein phosphotransferase [Rhizobiaceae bacterium]|nr:phosphoenolpyruvate--protein phosphotransferase [Rhizobiaceae bacterium]
MASPLGPQERLDQVVRQIAAALGAQVCSVYVLRSDGIMELFATEGLNAQSVHNAQLRVGRGLVGTIAATGRPLNSPEAAEHPAFEYIPGTGEETFHSFCGVPMKRGGRPLGVLTVQTVEAKVFTDEDVEALETAAMVLSDLVVSGDLKELARDGTALDATRPVSQRASRLAPGIAQGIVVLHEPRIVITNFFAEDGEHELRRLAQGIRGVRDSVDELVLRGVGDAAADAGAEHADVLETYRMVAHDRGWVRRIEGAIGDGLTAEAATEKVAQENRAALARSADPYLRERMHDFDDLARRLLKRLVHGETPPEASERGWAEGSEKDFVVVARTMGAAELLDYNREHLVGLVLEEATPTSHVVIVARALDIPVVGKVGGIVSRAENGDTIIVDGDGGSVHLRPPEDVRKGYNERVAFRAERTARYDALRDKPAITRDGVPIGLMLNAGLTMDLPQIEATGAAGIGLFRTELQFMVAATLPRMNQQARFYRSVLEAAGDKPVTFRTLDIGGDKVLPYLRTVKEDNPALGWRAIRLSLDRPGLLRMQLRALLKAAEGRLLRIKLPMVTVVTEIDEVRVMLDKEIEAQARFGHALPDKIELGVMIEVPSLLWQLDELMKRVDFVSVGSNDLFQFMAASDRTNHVLANRFDPLSRPFMRALRQIARVADAHDTELQLCGELAGDALSAMALLGIGYRMISMPPAAIGPVKEMVLAVDLANLRAMMEEAVDDPTGEPSLHDILSDYADTHSIPV